MHKKKYLNTHFLYNFLITCACKTRKYLLISEANSDSVVNHKEKSLT